MLGVVHSLVATCGRLAKQKPLKRLRAGVPAVSDHINTKPLNTVEHLVIYFHEQVETKTEGKGFTIHLLNTCRLSRLRNLIHSVQK